jgi:hypothetical protein
MLRSSIRRPLTNTLTKLIRKVSSRSKKPTGQSISQRPGLTWFAGLEQRLTRALEFARCVTRRDSATQAGLAHIDALAEVLRVVSVVTVRNAHALLLGIIGLFFRARSEADCKPC